MILLTVSASISEFLMRLGPGVWGWSGPGDLVDLEALEVQGPTLNP